MERPSNKRRRVNAATALSKPFKSPLHRPEPRNTDDTPSKSAASRTPDDTKFPATLTTAEPETMSNPPSPTATSVSPRRRRTLQLFPPSPFQTSDPEVLELEKQYRSIKAKVDAVIAKLETATQARDLETNPRYIEIPTLITKWRLASQDAADEVFVGAKERVNRMGGLAAWKEQTKRNATRWEFDEERREREHIDEDGGDDNLGAEDSSGHLTNKNNGEYESESEDEGFTMDFMLKNLRIHPTLIGYDVKAQKWIKS
ncbi:hypothetical protein N7491_007650 [Penicillium cf. griseofulvum]|uniref:DNA repair protein Dds20/Mei5 n=1 Tax=Penicillium cf. griseofulvum TaxID=2972120 RepID=A0A9W9IX85_9EURO|nr:hypothetical protein N7472_009325 [Penicillium cf. griseofulvum]KAJ5430634.1 hypothetical protein N7491_007650 [Penicillium cf. griseofulvum]KAJ5435598.1 hypothetical protein N7445_006483 [Penicillium cf. griseofulvum]